MEEAYVFVLAFAKVKRIVTVLGYIASGKLGVTLKRYLLPAV